MTCTIKAKYKCSNCGYAGLLTVDNGIVGCTRCGTHDPALNNGVGGWRFNGYRHKLADTERMVIYS